MIKLLIIILTLISNLIFYIEFFKKCKSNLLVLVHNLPIKMNKIIKIQNKS